MERNPFHDNENCHCHVPQNLQYAVNLIECKETLVLLIKKMSASGILNDFLLMLEIISKGKLDCDNLPLNLAVELAKLKNCGSASGIKYNSKTLDFWVVFYQSCHSSRLNLLSGSKNHGYVTANETGKGKYNPSKGSFNFAVPDVKTLLCHQRKVDKFLTAGILQGSFDVLDKMKQFILEYDAKRLSSGLSKDELGNVNLWGFENPNLEKEKAKLQEELQIIEKLKDLDTAYNEELFILLKDMVVNTSMRIKVK